MRPEWWSWYDVPSLQITRYLTTNLSIIVCRGRRPVRKQNCSRRLKTEDTLNSGAVSTTSPNCGPQKSQAETEGVSRLQGVATSCQSVGIEYCHVVASNMSSLRCNKQNSRIVAGLRGWYLNKLFSLIALWTLEELLWKRRKPKLSRFALLACPRQLAKLVLWLRSLQTPTNF